MNLRAKLLLGFGGLLAILTVVSVVSIVVITWYTHALEHMLHDNYRSVVYGQEMIEALDQLNGGAQSVAFGNVAMDNAFAAEQNKSRKLFQDNIDAERGNITEPGEGDKEQFIRRQWGIYCGLLDRMLASGKSTAERRKDFAALVAQSNIIKPGAQWIVDVNLKKLTFINDQAKEWARWARTVLYGLLGTGLLLGVVLIALVSQAILAPLRSFTASAKEIEAGNLNLMVQARSRDEVGQLAEAFNSMTAKLREFRRTDQAKLLRTQQTTQLAINSLPDAVAVINPEGIVELSNTTARRLFGLMPQMDLDNSSQNWLVDLFGSVLERNRPVEPKGYQSALQVFDNGTERFFLPHGLPILDHGNHLAGVTVILVDVTRLRQLDELKSSLVSTVSHELKTPLTSIRLANHLLLSERIGPLNAKQVEVIMTSREDSDRLQNIIENLLDMSRIESGKDALDFQPARPHTLISDAVDTLRAAIHDKGIKLDMDAPVDLPKVRADATRVHHLLMNLLTNALRYTPSGGEIRIVATEKDRFVMFHVQDTGSGIPVGYQSRIFEKFFRVPGQNSQGAGLGLAIVKEIVQAHGGTIELQSTEGAGTTFRFTLPRADVPVLQEA
jgi:two-component system, NtrC family, sensor histidine kinase KinB